MNKTTKTITGLRRGMAALLAAVAGVMASWGQTDTQLSHYYEVPTYYNPAAIGGSDMLRIRAGSRLQWLGMEKAPMTFLGVADTKLKLLGNYWGAGAVVQTESAGLFRNVSAALQLGWKRRLGRGELTVAVQPGILNETFKGSEVFIPDDDDYHTTGDEAIPTNDVSGTAFDLGVGLWYSHPRFWTGVSLQHALSPTVTFQSEGTGGGATTESEKQFKFRADRTLYFMAGCNIPVKNTLFEVMPSVMFRTDFTFWGAEATARARYNKFLTFGVGYRWDDAVTAILGVEIKGFFLSYSFDYATSSVMKASSGSHEIIAGYSMKLDFSEKNKNRHKSIRIM